MYHTFQASSTSITSDGDNGKAVRPSGSRRISTTNACVECRRRKIRCDGAQPCGQCMWYQHPERCTYAKPTQRVVPSRKVVEKLQAHVDQYSLIFSRLFPGKDPGTLASLPREELINLALTLPATATSPSTTSETAAIITQAVQKSDGADSLEALEQAPDQEEPEVDEARRHKDKVQGITDDVNGLSLAVDKQSSYVGVSSISAALKVIFKTAPAARPFILQSYTDTALPSRNNSPPPEVRELDPRYLPPADVGHRLIESYFAKVHILMPMIDEDNFWHTYLYGQRSDPPWLALLNMVLAFGSLAESTCEKEEHITYFLRSRSFLDLESFGSGNILVLQTLGLMNGYYLHWLNRPNEANSLMGATMRMATALGLHREYSEVRSGPTNERVINQVPVEIRRRTWWSLFCLDTWAYMSMGRPSLGRISPGVTVESPKIPEQMNNAQYLASLRLLPIIHNITFCKLATKIQDKLASQPLLKPDELFGLDAELVRWHEDLPPILQAVAERTQQGERTNSTQHAGRKQATPSASSASNASTFDFSQPVERDNTSCPEVLKTPRAIMHWRYMTMRMLMHRPYLLATALRRASYTNMSADERVAVSKCRIIAGQSINDIDATCQDDLIAGWNAVWIMYQAVMVPLVSLFSYLCSPAAYTNKESPGRLTTDAPTGTDEDADKWRNQIEKAIEFFDRMQRYSVAARKSKDVVTRLYDASKHVRQYHEAFYLQQQLQHSQQQQMSPPEGFGMAAASEVFNMTGVTSTVKEEEVQNDTLNTGFHQSVWGLSPNGDATMTSFWDDMMWDTFPMQGVTDDAFMSGIDQNDWFVPNGQHEDNNLPHQDWTQWNLNDQEQP